MIVGGAVAGFAVERTDAVAVLRDLERGPVIFAQSRDQASDYAGLAYAARVSADYDNCYGDRFRGRGARTTLVVTLSLPIALARPVL